ncbi:hypothetical protein HMPREF9130_0979 [Peptoniphilus sp. oral taxon 375 str. F0436]|nr:hypothetical protein HMPREF9130_0979 [Peptoniphilus sp. oral taxon 375 str. F0436]
MGLDFIYLQDEDYEFVLKKESLKLEPIQKLIQMLESQVFRNAVDALGGYTTSQSGHVRYYEG